jgi:hypothetical protein
MPNKKLDGICRIAKERKRQIEEEGWDIDHDILANNDNQLALAAAVYATPKSDRGKYNSFDGILTMLWPWNLKWYKPSKNRIRELEKAGALIAAEIDRLLAAKNQRR